MPRTTIQTETEVLWNFIQTNYNAHPDHETLFEIIQLLGLKELVSQANINAVAINTDPESLRTAFEILDERNLLNQTNFNRVVQSISPIPVAEAIYVLDSTQLYTDHNCDVLQAYPQLSALKNAVRGMTHPEKLNMEHLIYFLESGNTYYTAMATNTLVVVGLFSEELVSLIVNHDNPYLLDIFETLHAAGISTLHNFHSILGCEYDYEDESLKDILGALQLAGILTQDLFEIMLKLRDLNIYYKPINALNSVPNLLTRTNLETLLHHPYPNTAARVITTLSNRRFLNEAVFNAIFVKCAEVLWNANTVEHWPKIKAWHFPDIIAICERPLPEVHAAFTAFIGNLSLRDMPRGLGFHSFNQGKRPHPEDDEPLAKKALVF